MDEWEIGPLGATILGAVLAGVVAGAFGVLADSPAGAAIGMAVAMPLFLQYGYGFGGMDRERYHGERDREGLLFDAAVIVTAGIVVGGGAAVLATELDVGIGIRFALAAGGAFAGGGGAFLVRAGEYHE